jgi:Fe-S-cluster containining protein
MRNMDIKLTEDGLKALFKQVEAEHGPYCAICGEVVSGSDRDLAHKWTKDEIFKTAQIEARKTDNYRLNFPQILREIQLRIDLLRLIHIDCKHKQRVESKQKRIDVDAAVSSSTIDLAAELSMLDSAKMNLGRMMETPVDQMTPEQIKEFQRLYLSWEVIEWLGISIELTARYGCHRCNEGKCCTESVVEIRPNEVEFMASHLKMKPEEFLKKYSYLEENGKPFLRAPCPFYRRGKKGSRYPVCQIYPVRPLVCRIYPLTGLLTVRNIDGCIMARDIMEDLKKIRSGVKLDEFEKSLLPYIKRVKETLKNEGIPSDVNTLSDELEKITKERMPDTPIKVRDQRMLRMPKQAFRELLSQRQQEEEDEADFEARKSLGEDDERRKAEYEIENEIEHDREMRDDGHPE